ncbi:MAG: hypothetical protein CM15mP129_10540 [Chloroflexota bacterium]|nr:MAG: hypothetical protein CM15mP129_10540 [Chloroflexota bacterium]
MQAVVDSANIDKFPIFGVSQGCAVSIAYAYNNQKGYAIYCLGILQRGREGKNV